MSTSGGTSGGGPDPATTVTGPDAFADPAVVGVSLLYARGDHDHGLPAAPAGSTPSDTVTGPDSYGDGAAAGAATEFSRGDHNHGLPAAPAVPAVATTVAGPAAYGDAAVVGVGTNYARNDHDHGLPAAPAVPAVATTVAGPAAYGDAPVVGVGTNYARNDHDHGLPAAPTVSLTSHAGSLETDVAVSAGATTLVLTTASLAVGTWLVNVGVSFYASVTSGGCAIWLGSGTATATITGQRSAETFISGSALWGVASVTTIVTVTAAGTLTVMSMAQSNSVAARASAGTNPTTGGSGYTAVKIA